MSSSGKLSVEIVEFKSMERATLRGFASIRIPAMCLTIRDCTVNESNGRRWVGLPGKAQIDREGQTIRRDGKIQYSAVCQFDSKEVSDAFSAAVLDALDRHQGR